VAQLYHWAPILVASYDTHWLRWDYSYSPVITRGYVHSIVIVNVTHKFWSDVMWAGELHEMNLNLFLHCFRLVLPKALSDRTVQELSEESYSSYFLLNIKVIQSRRIGWAGYVARMGRYDIYTDVQKTLRKEVTRETYACTGLQY
jgi:hypothetical protein